MKCVLRTTGLQVYEEHFSLSSGFAVVGRLQRSQFGIPNQYGQNVMTERGHIYWGHTHLLFSMLSNLHTTFTTIRI